MRKMFKLFVFIAFILMAITSCDKRENEIEQKKHLGKYEVFTKDGTVTEANLIYVFGNNLYESDGEVISETVNIPWEKEFQISNPFPFNFSAEIDAPEIKPFVARIYVDGNVVAEGESDIHNSIHLHYTFIE